MSSKLSKKEIEELTTLGCKFCENKYKVTDMVEYLLHLDYHRGAVHNQLDYINEEIRRVENLPL